VSRLADRRLRLVLALSLAAFAIVVIRAAQLQVVDAAALSRKAISQQRGVEVIPGLRGSILSANGQVLAQTQWSKTIVSDPEKLRNPVKEALVIARALGYHQFRVVKHRGKHRKHRKLKPNPAWPAKVQAIADQLRGGGYALRQLSPDTVDRIMARHLPGISAVNELVRWYPFHDLASQVLGYTSIDGTAGADEGAGLEHEYNRDLSGRPGSQVFVHDPTGQTVLKTVRLRRPVPGRDMTLTLDTQVQAKVQAVLTQTVRASHAAWATGIVLDPRTGAVLSMATAPGYDNDGVHSLKNFAATHNNALETTYEPGSTFKVVTFSAALSAGLIWPNETFANLPYKLRFGDKWIRDDAPRGPITLKAYQILQKSSNIGTDTIAQIVGKPLLMHWIRAYGFGRYTGLGWPGE